MKENYSTPRRQVRLEMNLPLRVRGRESPDHEWAEVTRFINVTQQGARFNLSRPTEPGRMLQLVSALPPQMRLFDCQETQYRVWALVTNVKFTQTEIGTPFQMEVGVALTGPRPPQEFETHPAQLYELAAPPENGDVWRVRALPYSGAKDDQTRPETRHPIAAEIELHTFERGDTEAVKELTVTENLSRKGAAVFTTLDLAEGRFVRVVGLQQKVSLIAVVRLRRGGADGRTRLHLEFISGEWPLEGV